MLKSGSVQAHCDAVLCMATPSTGGELLASGGEVLTFWWACIWNTFCHEYVKYINFELKTCRSSPRSASSQDGRVCLTDTATLATQGSLTLPGDVTSLAFRQGSAHEVYASCDTFVYKLDLRRVSARRGARKVTVNQVVRE